MKLKVPGGLPALLKKLVDAAPKLVNPPAPRILVTLEINISGASVEVDGTPRQPNKKGLLIFKKPGEKTIRVEKNGYLPQMFKLDLKKRGAADREREPDEEDADAAPSPRQSTDPLVQGVVGVDRGHWRSGHRRGRDGAADGL